MSFTLLPAVDVADGQAVRLVQGEAGTETGYGDPLDAALAWQRDGAEWIHLVDLDAAFGRGQQPRAARRRRRRAGRPSSCPAASATTPRWSAPWRPAVPGSTSAPPRWRTRPGARGPSPHTATRSPSGWTSDQRRRPPARRARLDHRRRRPLGDPRPPRPRRLRALRRHRRQQGRHAAGPERRPAARGRRGHARPGDRLRRDRRGRRPGDAGRGGRGGREHRGLDRRQGALRAAGSRCRRRWPRCVRSHRRAGRAGGDGSRRTGHPLPGRRRRAGGQGRQLPEPPRRRRPGRDGRASTTPRAPTS